MSFLASPLGDTAELDIRDCEALPRPSPAIGSKPPKGSLTGSTSVLSGRRRSFLTASMDFASRKLWGFGRSSAQSPTDTNSSSTRGSNLSSSRSEMSDEQSLIVEQMSTFRLSCPEVLRATHAGTTLRQFGSLLRPRLCGKAPVNEYSSEDEAFKAFSHSFVTDRIDIFWSHSWRANAWQKIMLLMLVYNGPPAALAGVLGSVVGSGLFALRVLPVMVWKPAFSSREDREDWDQMYGFAYWGLILGAASTVATMLLWHSRRRIFLDKVCIHQTDPKQRRQGIESIGAFIQVSDSMLVLWDPTYARRLWCVFEMAAFIFAHYKEHAPLNLHCRPVILGPTVFMMFPSFVTLATFMDLAPQRVVPFATPPVAMVLLCAFFVAVREYHRKLSVLNDEFSAFEVEKSECLCCDSNHINEETGEEMMCDRQLVEACIVAWFGSTDSFNRVVQTKMYSSFRRQLGRFAFPYHFLVMGALPTCWFFMDITATYIREGQARLAIAYFVNGSIWWLCTIPLLLLTTSALASKPYTQRWRHVPLIDALVVIFHAFAIGLAGGVTWFLWSTANAYVGEILSTAGYLVIALLSFGIAWVAAARNLPKEECMVMPQLSIKKTQLKLALMSSNQSLPDTGHLYMGPMRTSPPVAPFPPESEWLAFYEWYADPFERARC